MATYTTNGFYYLTKSTDGRYVIATGFSNDKTTVTSTVAGDTFSISDLVMVRATGYYMSEVIVAFTSDGVITKLNDRNYTLQTSNPNYKNGAILGTHTNPFPVCFVQGTLIETNRGPIPVEALVIGDQIVCSQGLRTVKWLGWRHYHAISLGTAAQRLACTPVRIKAGALGDNEPSQDLRVSPWHHLYVDGVLVRANDLINGKSIVQETETVEFGYYHVELDQFDVIRAHGVYSESWADGGNRDFFQNVDVTSLRPEDKKRRMADRPGFVALRKAADIAVIHDRIAARADAGFSVSHAA